MATEATAATTCCRVPSTISSTSESEMENIAAAPRAIETVENIPELLSPSKVSFDLHDTSSPNRATQPLWKRLRAPHPRPAREINVLTCTWNVGHAAPSAKELEAWLPAGGEGLDLLIVATQENAYTAKTALPRTSSRGTAARSTGGMRATTLEDANSDDENEHPDEESMRASDMPAASPSSATGRQRMFHALRRSRQSIARTSVGRGDLSSVLCCGKNLCGRSEHFEHWERLILLRLNQGRPASPDSSPGSPSADRGWRVCKHAVLAEMRLTVYERRLNHAPRGPVSPAASSPEASSAAHNGRRLGIRRRMSGSVLRGLATLGRLSSFTMKPYGVTFADRDRVALGKGGLLANKGGIAIELHVDETKLLIVASHLAAHDHAIGKRNKQVRLTPPWFGTA